LLQFSKMTAGGARACRVRAFCFTPPESEQRWSMSALPPIADIDGYSFDVRFVPKADMASDDSFV
jgi:hypothetical protein